MSDIDDPVVTDHAIVRYLERIVGLDMNHVRASILSEDVVDAINHGAKGVMTEHGIWVVENRRIVTLLIDGMRPTKRTKRGLVDTTEGRRCE